MGVGKSTFAFTSSSISINGGSTTINITRDNQSYSHKLSHGYGDLATLAVGTTSYKWTPTADSISSFLEEIPNQKSRLIDVYLDTYNGSTRVGRDVHALSVTLSEATGKPSLSKFAINDTNATTKGWGVIVIGKSVLSASQTATAKYGASIVKTVYTYGINEYSSITDLIASLPLTTTPKSYTIGCKTTDSRGFVTTASLSKSCAKYEAPTIDAFELIRCDAEGNETEAGTKVKAIVKGSWASIGGKNTATLKIGYKLQNGTSYTEEAVTVTNGTVNVEQVLSATLDASSDYLFSVSLADDMGVTFSEDGIGFSNSKNIMYVSADGEELILGSSSEGNILIGPDHVDIRKYEDVLASFEAERRSYESEYNPSTTYSRDYGKIVGNDGTIISCGHTYNTNTSEIAEILQYTKPDPYLTGMEAGVQISATVNTPEETSGSPTGNAITDEAYIHVGAKRIYRNSVYSNIDMRAEWIRFFGNRMVFYPNQEFGIDGTQNGASIGFKAKSIGFYPTESLTLGIPTVTGDCNKLINNGTWYLGNGSTNRPLDQNGWLTSKLYSTDYCHQTYITYTGDIYRRMMQAGKWGIWQGGYANVKKLWSGTLSKGGSVTVANLSLFDTFILGTSSGTAMLIGTRYYDPSNNRGTTVLFTAGHDDGTTSFLYKATTSMNGNTFKLTSCSVHTLDYNGCGGNPATVKSLYGVM